MTRQLKYDTIDLITPIFRNPKTFTVGGNLIEYLLEATTQTAEIVTTKYFGTVLSVTQMQSTFVLM